MSALTRAALTTPLCRSKIGSRRWEVGGVISIDEILKHIRIELLRWRREEEACRHRREALEMLLRKIENQEQSQAKPEASGRRRVATDDVAKALEKLLSDGRIHRLSRLEAGVREEVQRQVAGSTIRGVLARNERFERVEQGSYRLREPYQETEG